MSKKTKATLLDLPEAGGVARRKQNSLSIMSSMGEINWFVFSNDPKSKKRAKKELVALMDMVWDYIDSMEE